MRLEYAPNVRIIKTMCTGKVEVSHLLRAFEEGIDAAFVAGWEEGDCHFLEGNLRAKKRVNQVKKLLEEVGLEGDRIEMYNIGASDAVGFAKACNEMVERARNLGPNPLRFKEEAKTGWL
jgi:F420-non-reducing hydrogenase iron-sulfur subunit